MIVGGLVRLLIGIGLVRLLAADRLRGRLALNGARSSGAKYMTVA